MKLLTLAVLSVMCTLNQAITFSTVATVSLTLISLNKPVSCFFGIFRRRKSPVQETAVASSDQNPFSFANQPMTAAFNPFAFGSGGFMFPGFGNRGFGIFGPPSNRFPPQPAPARPPRIPQREVHSNRVPSMSSQPAQLQFQPQSHPPAVPFDMDSFRDGREDVPGMNVEEAESFFTLLAETDESKCISRLVCEMGANPETGGEFGQTVVEIIGSLTDFPDGSKVSDYNEVLSFGMAEGLSACMSKFSVCDEESYQLVKRAQLEE